MEQGAGQYTYRIKGKEAVWAEIQRIGECLALLLRQLHGDYGQKAIYATAQRFFDENFHLIETKVKAKKNHEISAGCCDLWMIWKPATASKATMLSKVMLLTCPRLLILTIRSNWLLCSALHLTAPVTRNCSKQDVPAIQARMELNLWLMMVNTLGHRSINCYAIGTLSRFPPP